MQDLKIQKSEHGVGPLYHRVYSVDIACDREHAMAVMKKLQIEMDTFSPQWLARFEKTTGDKKLLREGDEFQVFLDGPFQAPVRVNKVTEEGFSFATLEGHLEAGEIHFRIRETGPKQMRFEIESLARSKDKIVDFFYDKIPIARIAQSHMWTEFCKSFARSIAEHGCGNVDDEPNVNILTERQDEESKIWTAI